MIPGPQENDIFGVNQSPRADVASRPDAVMVFDLDGVVTDPASGQVNHAVLEAATAELKQGIPMAFITGRAYEWVDRRIMPFVEEVCTPDEMSKFLVIAEKSGVRAVYTDGEVSVEVDEGLSPSQAFKNDAEELLEYDQGGWKLGEKMFWDFEKKTMVSIEREPAVPLQEFTDVRPILVSGLSRLLEEHGLEDFVIDQTTIATDVEHKGASKMRGAQKVLAWLAELDIKPQSFIAFGDSASDAAMAEAFGNSGVPTDFVFVGEPEKIQTTGQEPYITIATGGGYANDTANFLKQLQRHQ